MQGQGAEWWLIRWRDSEADIGWLSDAEVKITGLPVDSVGVILKEENGFLILASCVGACGTGRQNNRRLEIPVENIITRTRMVQSRKSRAKKRNT